MLCHRPSAQNQINQRHVLNRYQALGDGKTERINPIGYDHGDAKDSKFKGGSTAGDQGKPRPFCAAHSLSNGSARLRIEDAPQQDAVLRLGP